MITTSRMAATSTTRCSSRSTSGSAAGCSSRAATTTSGATNCAAARRRPPSTATLAAPSGSPLNSDPIAVGFFQNAFPQVVNRQESTNWQGRAIARYVFKYDIGVATNLRVQSGYGYSRDHQRNAAECGRGAILLREHQEQPVGTVPILDLRVDKAFRIGRYQFTGMFDAYNLTNSNAITNFT